MDGFNTLRQISLIITALLFLSSCAVEDPLLAEFQTPPETAKPGVYWYFMDGNLSKEEMTKDLESMKAVGINHVIFLEVGIGVPRGPVDFMSEEWQDMFVHAVNEIERLDMKLLMGAGPGWCGSGGPWIEPEQAMKHLVFSETTVEGGKRIEKELPVPEQRSTIWHTFKDPYYRDLYLYAIPSHINPVITDINEKALYERDPYSSKPNVKAHLPSRTSYQEPKEDLCIRPASLLDITEYMDDSGHLTWDAPDGEWTIIRMGTRVTGASTRPSPEPVIGLECNKLNADDFAHHLSHYTDILLEKTGATTAGVGWTGFHVDSWESGAQNWTRGIVDEFQKRRGYDPEPYLVTFTGRAFKSLEISERFLWDWRKTCQELLLENHISFARDYAHEKGLELTIEPYDMNPAGDIDLGSYADVIMAEFWSDGYGFETAYAVLQATSISHISGRPVVGAEVFTANHTEVWQQYPGSMKDQGDWALAMGVNRFAYHTFAHKPLGDSLRPGMSMGSIGIHWDRGQSWWPMVDDYHTYISRVSHVMQEGQYVSDILYLTPEGAPMVFTPPADALFENRSIPDKKAYGFDACSPIQLMEHAEVEKGKIVFPGATSYEILVLPTMRTMTPELLNKITELVEAGAHVIGSPPIKSPGLQDYPNVDSRVQQASDNLWGAVTDPQEITEIAYGKGRLFWGGELSIDYTDSTLYPSYDATIGILEDKGIQPDFQSDHNTIRYGHRKTNKKDIYFIANRTPEYQKIECTFRASGEPEMWIPISGEIREIENFRVENNLIIIPLEFYPHESFVIVFEGSARKDKKGDSNKNSPSFTNLLTIDDPWEVSFNSRYGAPDQIVFDRLIDWTSHADPNIKYYSGIAAYKNSFELKEQEGGRLFIDLGVVHEMARVILNGKDLGVVWTAPWQIEVTENLKQGKNEIEIRVANRWINRILGDRIDDDDKAKKVRFENGLLGGKEVPVEKYTFTLPGALSGFHFTEPLPAGLVGPVMLKQEIN